MSITSAQFSAIEDTINRIASESILAQAGRGDGLVSAFRVLGDLGDFSRHALCTALAAEVLAETTECVNPQTDYTAGLGCDIGKLAVGHSCAAFFPAIRTHCASRGGTWSQAEREVLGYTQAEVGARC